MNRLRAPLIGLAIVILPSVARCGEEADRGWPCWRGPNGDGISPEVGFPKKWPQGGLEKLWTIELGAGFSSFAAVGDHLYTEREQEGNQEVVCIEAATGRIVWTQVLESAYGEWQGGNGPRATPCVKDGIVHALGAKGTLAALNASDGKPLWQLNVLEKLKCGICWNNHSFSRRRTSAGV